MASPPSPAGCSQARYFESVDYNPFVCRCHLPPGFFSTERDLQWHLSVRAIDSDPCLRVLIPEIFRRGNLPSACMGDAATVLHVGPILASFAQAAIAFDDTDSSDGAFDDSDGDPACMVTHCSHHCVSPPSSPSPPAGPSVPGSQ